MEVKIEKLKSRFTITQLILMAMAKAPECGQQFC